ncbi:RluA family pseudouridine synthase [Helicobacter aurati]|uniref:RNA pseudouridylate synthase n=1 Tax=Helicobacter aurati TaxID=137778 RepID=A0A3D8J8K1_9HELI|nr:RluA family pseudouridine synthase [Helicobacter aurati]RDU73748.1 RluA family pseudouridine synthase [Helicobacter aurati]
MKHNRTPKTSKICKKTAQSNQSNIKAYKLLSLQEGISTNKAKQLIDNGVVQVNGKRLEIARLALPYDTKFVLIKPKHHTIFEDSNLLILDKSYGIECYALEKQYSPYKLINRLDRDTSGVILIAKNETIRQKAIQEFKAQKVKKVYFALVEGKISEEMEISENILVQSQQTKKRAFVSKQGMKAHTIITPVALIGKQTLLEICILTGRTHQIRIHLASIQHPIIGDIIYNKKSSKHAKRLMLHCHKTTLFDKEFTSSIDIYQEFGIQP